MTPEDGGGGCQWSDARCRAAFIRNRKASVIGREMSAGANSLAISSRIYSTARITPARRGKEGAGVQAAGVTLQSRNSRASNYFHAPKHSQHHCALRSADSALSRSAYIQTTLPGLGRCTPTHVYKLTITKNNSKNSHARLQTEITQQTTSAYQTMGVATRK